MNLEEVASGSKVFHLEVLGFCVELGSMFMVLNPCHCLALVRMVPAKEEAVCPLQAHCPLCSGGVMPLATGERSPGPAGSPHPHLCAGPLGTNNSEASKCPSLRADSK